MISKNILDTCKLVEFIAIDLEATGLIPKEESIIEVSAIKFKNGKEESTFTYLLAPDKLISPFIEDLTGISNEMVKGKPSFLDILDELIDFIGNMPIVGHNVQFDINFIKYHSNDRYDLSETNLVCDTYLLSKLILFSNEQHSLESISEFYNLSTEGSHRALNDARNSGKILIRLIEELVKFDSALFSRLSNLFSLRNVFNATIINNLSDYKNTSMNGNKIFKVNHPFIRYVSKKKKDPQPLENVIGENGMLYDDSKNLFRESQYQMAKSIENNIYNNDISMIEAGTGLGKTYAYLIPFILSSYKTDTPLIISTYTKSLQDQLFYKDLKYILNLIDIDFNGLILKGRNNYICLNRLNHLESNSDELIRDFECHDLAAIIVWSYYTKSGDIEECSSFSIARNFRLWNLVKSDVRFCQKQCNHLDTCFYSKLTNYIQESNVIIVNHALFMSDAIENRNLLPREHLFVIDEAHDLFKATKDILTLEYDRSSLMDYLSDISILINKDLKDDSPDNIKYIYQRIQLTMEDVELFFKSYLDSKTLGNSENPSYPSVSMYNDIEIEFQDCSPTLMELFENLKKLKNMFLLIDEDNPKYINFKKNGLIDLINQFMDYIEILFSCSDSDDYLSWMKYFQKTQTCSINYLYKDIGKILFEKYFKNNNIGLLCSATMTVNNSFDYFISSIGLNDLTYDVEIKKLILPSPFFLEDQLSFYSFKSELNINSDEYIDKISEQIFEISSYYNKRMLVLCTSYKQASQIKNRLRSRFSKINKRLLVHEKGRSKSSLIRAYKGSKNSVLIGTMAFWEGIDLPGSELSILMMLRIPFSNPNDPYMRYMNEKLSSQGENGFNEIQVPDACLKMKQGFGRLIRTEDDSGIFIVTDPRIYNSTYGYKILNSFPVETIPYQHFSTILNNKKIL